MPSAKELEDAGFIEFEVKELADIKGMTATPYFDEFIIERQWMLLQSLEKGETLREYRVSIVDMYRSKDWMTNDKPDPFKMLRDIREDYFKKHPDYAPEYHYKRKHPPKTPELFDEKYDAGLVKAQRTGAKYPKGAAYR